MDNDAAVQHIKVRRASPELDLLVHVQSSSVFLLGVDVDALGYRDVVRIDQSLQHEIIKCAFLRILITNYLFLVGHENGEIVVLPRVDNLLKL